MNNKNFQRLSIPYKIWLYIFACAPILVMLVLSFVDSEGIDMSDASFSWNAFEQLASSSTLIAFLNSFIYAGIATLTCIFFGYLVAYRIYKSHIKNKFLVLTVLILPMWSNILLRIEALKSLLEPHNIITDILSKMGIHAGVSLSGTPFAVIVGLIATYLPFMVLQIYNSLEKIDPSLEQASLDLGMPEIKTFWKVTFPISSKGIVTGSIMVFLPCFSGFAIPEILGNGNIVLIGNVLDQAFRNMDYGTGSLLALIILLLILGSIFLVSKFDKEGETLV